MWAQGALDHDQLLANQIGSAAEFMTVVALVIIVCTVIVVARQRRRLVVRGIFMPSGNKAVDQYMADGILDVIQQLYLNDKITGRQYRRLITQYGRAFKLADLKPRKRKLGKDACTWLKAQIRLRRGNHTRIKFPDSTYPGAGTVDKQPKAKGQLFAKRRSA